MIIKAEEFPLYDLLVQLNAPGIDNLVADMAKAQKGDLNDAYQVALGLYQVASIPNIDAQIPDLTQEVKDQTLAKCAEVFCKAAAEGHKASKFMMAFVDEATKQLIETKITQLGTVLHDHIDFMPVMNLDDPDDVSLLEENALKGAALQQEIADLLCLPEEFASDPLVCLEAIVSHCKVLNSKAADKIIWCLPQIKGMEAQLDLPEDRSSTNEGIQDAALRAVLNLKP